MSLHFRQMIIVAVAFFSANILNAQSKDEQAIRALMAKQEQAWNNGNIDQFMEGYIKSDSLLFIGAKGPGYGWKNTLDNYKKRYPDTATMGTLQFELMQLKPLGKKHFFVLGKWHLTRSIGDIGGFYTLLFVKEKGAWYIMVDHTS